MKQRFIKYICLSILGEMAISFYILADTFFIAQGIGDKGLTALNLAIPVFNFIYGIGLMLGIGSGIRLSILKIDHKHDEINQVFNHTVLLGLVIGALFMITGVLYSPSLARMLGANDAVLQDTVIYLRTIMIFTPAFIFNNALNALVRNDNNPEDWHTDSFMETVYPTAWFQSLNVPYDTSKQFQNQLDVLAKCGIVVLANAKEESSKVGESRIVAEIPSTITDEQINSLYQKREKLIDFENGHYSYIDIMDVNEDYFPIKTFYSIKDFYAYLDEITEKKTKLR